ncbi:MAG: cyclic nucleotide-binding domain-containing protein [Bacteriovoracaceae bacterium]|jgi:CRP-like cAMP-binding protein|nr:hypothetical protein [Halobacteriovoraceae bacterium]MDP7320335.1 cyclic nucleotide-binding domain-containing protein [Bacteriovoracaceae bacterium]|tara:strand:+ start:605 stop:967 length:363 start_codon:yes stop_codon:yes gene_type:complete
MKKLVLDTLSPEHINDLLTLLKPHCYQTPTELIYEGHIPRAGYLLLSGEVEFYKKKKLISRIGANHLFGVYELMTNTSLPYTAYIKANSRVLILDKTTIKELILNRKTSELPHVFDLIAG